jgi:amino acid transporter
MEIILTVIFGLFVLWLGVRILEKAGIEAVWVLTLLIPVVNIIMIWIFAFMDWPKLKKNPKREF